MDLSYQKLYLAYLDCRQNKRNTANALKFELELENNLQKLLGELRDGSYRPGRSICFVVTEPKPREIFAADFRDRIVHHLFVREVIEEAERMFIYDSYACRKGKGTHRAVKRLREEIRFLRRNRISPGWYMKLDIRSFFMSIDKDILYGLALELIDRHRRGDAWKLDMADLAGTIIFNSPAENYIRKGDPALARLIPAHKSLLCQSANRGLPIGNYSSQFFANLYLNKLDHYIKCELKCRYYLRYVDDLLILSENRDELPVMRDRIDRFLREHLRLALNCAKTVIQPLGRGVDFLGYYLKSGKIYPRRTVVARFKEKLYTCAIGRRVLPFIRLRQLAASFDGHTGAV